MSHVAVTLQHSVHLRTRGSRTFAFLHLLPRPHLNVTRFPLRIVPTVITIVPADSHVVVTFTFPTTTLIRATLAVVAFIYIHAADCYVYAFVPTRDLRLNGLYVYLTVIPHCFATTHYYHGAVYLRCVADVVRTTNNDTVVNTPHLVRYTRLRVTVGYVLVVHLRCQRIPTFTALPVVTIRVVVTFQHCVSFPITPSAPDGCCSGCYCPFPASVSQPPFPHNLL